MYARTIATLTLIAALAGSSCRRAPAAPEAVIVGTVIDNFGRPVEGAVVSFRDAAFRATTNARGEFSVAYAPGTFQVRIEAPNCAGYARELQVTQAVRYPLGTRMLFRIPEEPHEAVVVAAEEGYRALPSVNFERQVVDFGSAFSAFPNRCAVFTLGRPVVAGGTESREFDGSRPRVSGVRLFCRRAA